MLTGAGEAPGWREVPGGAFPPWGARWGCGGSPPAPAALTHASRLPATEPAGLAPLWLLGLCCYETHLLKEKCGLAGRSPPALPVTMHVAVGREGKREVGFPEALCFTEEEARAREWRCGVWGHTARLGRAGGADSPPSLRLTSGWAWPAWEGLLGAEGSLSACPVVLGDAPGLEKGRTVAWIWTGEKKGQGSQGEGQACI